MQHKKDVKSQTPPTKGASVQVSGTDTEPLLDHQTGSALVQGPNDRRESQHEVQENKRHDS